jgi:hypothetical protein
MQVSYKRYAKESFMKNLQPKEKEKWLKLFQEVVNNKEC